jgi:hypothetical protein
MDIRKFLEEKKQAVLDGWFDLSIGTYPEDSISFLKGQKNRFANPVGYTIRKGMEMIVDDLIAGARGDSLTHHLDDIIKIRAVQDFYPDQAVGFIFLLKSVIREVLGNELSGEKSLWDQLYTIESEIDRMILAAFRLYVAYREKLHELRIKEVSARTELLLRKLGAKYGVPEERPEV